MFFQFLSTIKVNFVAKIMQSAYVSVVFHFKGAVSAVQFILFNFANYSPSIAMELKVSKEITGK